MALSRDLLLSDLHALQAGRDGAAWDNYGLEPERLARLLAFCDDRLPVRSSILQIGAGLSTLCFLQLDPARLVSIAPDPELFARIWTYCFERDVDAAPLEAIVDGSQWALPELAAASRDLDPPFDLALLEGRPNWPMAMVDFHYANYLVRPGGFIVLSNLQLHSARELARLISFEARNFRTVFNLERALVFEKVSDQRELPDWFDQAYIRQNSHLAWRRYALGLGAARRRAGLEELARRAARLLKRLGVGS